MKPTIPVKFLPSDKIVDASQDETLLDAGLRAGIDIPTSCGGSGTCGTCRVFIMNGLELLPPRNEIEIDFAEDRDFAPNERLSCQNYPVAGLVIEVPPE
ncbi:MAG: (2Fe-2S)-binding protein [Bdellovibrionaceae bacterium]|nr:(2Fe-2S)-binding protein [Pseudobdellovibrionaceae bacterium]